ncbi:hypothetical protein [Marinagarivorans algicola]|uniref:hypothetical protein n=1 Tax=Marinagarivorans algicola TaxID=1513270 RepID=UPI0006B8D0FA|nr:hypothetical protein [Marinagarivorans algicola]
MSVKLIASSAFLVGVTSLANPSFADTYATALFDKTGSMNITRAASNETRCEYGKKLFLQTVSTGILRADFLNVKTFAGPGQLDSITMGFSDVRGLNPYAGPGLALFESISAEINAVSCSGATSLGDALCESMDELKAIAGATQRRVGLVTDASENSSTQCGGGVPDYINNHIVPRLTTPPPIIFNVTILQTANGNVGLRALTTSQELSALQGEDALQDSSIWQDRSLEQYEWPTLSRSTEKAAVSATTEVQALINAAVLSGGGAKVIGDSQVCTEGCDPESQDPSWGGGW